MDESQACWVCLCGTEAGELIIPCKCPSLYSHPVCLARWQLQQAGRAEELCCRFCNALLPTWAHSLLAKTAQEVASIYFQDKRIVEPSRREDLLTLLRDFVGPNEDPNKSPNFRSKGPDPLRCFIEILMNGGIQQDADAVLLLLKSVKILSRKQENRARLGADGIRAILLNLAPPLTPQIAAEGANALLNICYEPENVAALLNTTGVKQLVGFLSEPDLTLQANSAGAIQSICFQAKGRQAIRDLDGIQSLLPLLGCGNTRVVARAAGAIHNLSSDAESIRIIRRYCGIPRLVELLADANIAVAGSAAGALQNVSRELASRLLIRELDAVPPLANLLSCQDVHAQVCAAGALLNILGPEMEDGLHGPGASKRGLGAIMALVMATAMVYDGVFERRPDVT